MTDNQNIKQRFEEFRPTKALWIWSCVGAAALTMIVGFTVGGWVTGGTAQEMTENAVEEARAQLVASVCVEKFAAGPDFAAKLASLKEADSWKQDDFIEEGGWVTLAGMTEPVGDAAELCAKQLSDMEAPPTEAAAAVTPEATPAVVTTPGG